MVAKEGQQTRGEGAASRGSASVAAGGGVATIAATPAAEDLPEAVTSANPPIRVTVVAASEDRRLAGDARKFRVVRDDDLVGGTKQRALVEYIFRRPAREFVYAGPTCGYAQVALAVAAQRLGKQGTAAVAMERPMSDLTRFAQSLGAKVLEKRRPNFMKAVKAMAEEYVATKEAREGPNAVELLPFGLQSEEYIDMLAGAVRRALPQSLVDDPPRRVWLACGSGVILRALHRVWPTTFFFPIQVGKQIYDDIVEGIRHKIFKAPEKFYEDALWPPPFRSVKNYDAKIWQFVAEHGEDGDLIWNVGKDAPSRVQGSEQAGSRRQAR